MAAQQTASEQHFIDVTVSQKLSDHGVAHDSPVKAMLSSRAEIETTGTQAAVYYREDDGRRMTIDAKLQELRESFMYRHHFPKGPATVSARDMRATRENFAEIASGRIKVV